MNNWEKEESEMEELPVFEGLGSRKNSRKISMVEDEVKSIRVLSRHNVEMVLSGKASLSIGCLVR